LSPPEMTFQRPISLYVPTSFSVTSVCLLLSSCRAPVQVVRISSRSAWALPASGSLVRPVSFPGEDVPPPFVDFLLGLMPTLVIHFYDEWNGEVFFSFIAFPVPPFESVGCWARSYGRMQTASPGSYPPPFRSLTAPTPRCSFSPRP